ncbi:tetratricopeptide repeat protein 33 isoform X1 [Electrophorus electricus]|uniref:tetratricopeptide repeat protein 33 isoform X1 n=1 Tax=Electrophorus electricus TaxID=8005 RepID=UPI000F0A7C35|nr:tetratricopeptide repeat protein 33 isoform X1 [Electrophorus electricus]
MERTMASFGWKRKVGERVSKAAVQQFEMDSEKVEDNGQIEGVDWLHVIKRRRELLLEDCTAKSKRLKEEGVLLAENGRHWEAIKKWDEAIQMNAEEATLYEMKSQVLTILQEVFPAVQAAETAVRLRPNWWEAWQTLGRAQLSLGEVELAVRSFQVAVHLNPLERTLWEEDLSWALRLQDQKCTAQRKAAEEDEARRLIDEAPELQRDYEDFESDDVINACTAVAERQKRYENLKRMTVVVNTQGVATEVAVGGDNCHASNSVLVKARVL